MPDWLKILIPSAIGLATTVCAAYFSALWATRHAFKQRWWDRKEKAYSEIIDALHDMLRYSDLSVDGYLSGRSDDHPKEVEFSENYNRAYWQIQKMTDIGAFIISDEAVVALTKLRKRPRLKWEESPPWEIFEEDSKHYREALAAIRSCARADLKV